MHAKYCIDKHLKNVNSDIQKLYYINDLSLRLEEISFKKTSSSFEIIPQSKESDSANTVCHLSIFKTWPISGKQLSLISKESIFSLQNFHYLKISLYEKKPGNRSFKYIALGIIYFYIKEAVCHNSEDSPFIKRGICHICLRIHFQSYFILLLNLVQTFHVKFCTALCTTFYVKKMNWVLLLYFFPSYLHKVRWKSIGFAIPSSIFNYRYNTKK